MTSNALPVATRQQSADGAFCAVCGLHHAAGTPCPVTAALPVRAGSSAQAPGTLIGRRFAIEEVTQTRAFLSRAVLDGMTKQARKVLAAQPRLRA